MDNPLTLATIILAMCGLTAVCSLYGFHRKKAWAEGVMYMGLAQALLVNHVLEHGWSLTISSSVVFAGGYLAFHVTTSVIKAWRRRAAAKLTTEA